MIAFVLAGVLFALAVLHAFWAFGGRAGLRVAVPHTADATPTFRPTRALTLLVGLALLAASLTALSVQVDMPVRAPRGVLYLLAVVFLMRGVGDVRYVGLFKRVTRTPFAQWDTYLFTPLCLVMSAGFVMLARPA